MQQTIFMIFSRESKKYFDKIMNLFVLLPLFINKLFIKPYEI